MQVIRDQQIDSIACLWYYYTVSKWEKSTRCICIETTCTRIPPAASWDASIIMKIRLVLIYWRVSQTFSLAFNVHRESYEIGWSIPFSYSFLSLSTSLTDELVTSYYDYHSRGWRIHSQCDLLRNHALMNLGNDGTLDRLADWFVFLFSYFSDVNLRGRHHFNRNKCRCWPDDNSEWKREIETNRELARARAIEEK